MSELKKENLPMLARALKLAAKYGPFVRFYPEGSEGNDDVLDSAIKEGEKAAKTPEEQSAIDKARKSEQQLEQERANAARANEMAKQTQEELETANSEIEQLRDKLATAEAKATEAGITDVDLDETKYDEDERLLVKAIKNLNEKISTKDKRIAALEKKAETYETRSREEQAIATRNSAYEELLSDLDGEYGADCRNGAIKKFNELAAGGKVPKGKPAKATRIMEKCYKETRKEIDKAKADKKSSSLSLDSGSGGGTGPNLKGVEIKAGSLDEVATQYGQALKGYKSTGD